jgi:hypothetical protein
MTDISDTADISEEQRGENLKALRLVTKQLGEFDNTFVTHLAPETIQRNQEIRDLVELGIPIFVTLLELDKNVSPIDHLARKAVEYVKKLTEAATNAVDRRGKNGD